MAVINCLGGGGKKSLLDLSDITIVDTVDENPTDSSPPLIEYNTIKYLLSIGGVSLQSDSIVFENISVSNWVSDNTYPEYSYSANVTLNNNVTSDMLYNIVYSSADYQSGNYAEFATLSNGSITLYSKTNTTTTIVAIIISY